MDKIHFMDIGARWGIGWPFCDLPNANLSLILVEPDPEEADRLQNFYKGKNIDIKIFQTALWSEAISLQLNLTNSPGCSSIFQPNLPVLKKFPDVERFGVSKKINIQCDTIDRLFANNEIKRVDFVKIDVQGAELEILKGGKSFFRDNLIGIEVEVEFLEVYKNQPLFAQVDNFLRNDLGLELWDISKTYWKYSHKKMKSVPAKGKLVFGDALYFRPIETIADWLSHFDNEISKSKIKVLIQTTLLYGYIDYAYALVEDERINKYFTQEEIHIIIKSIRKVNSGIHFRFKGSGQLYSIILSIANLFKPVYQKFASRNDLQLGSKRKFFFWNY